MGGETKKRLQASHHGGDVPLDILGGASKEVDPSVLNDFLAEPIACCLLGLVVDTAVDLDGKQAFLAEKIKHKHTNGVLAAEFETSKAAVTQFRPKQHFRLRQPLPQLPCSRDVMPMHSLIHSRSLAGEWATWLLENSPLPSAVGEGPGVREPRPS
jgi:hypothetical protein